MKSCAELKTYFQYIVIESMRISVELNLFKSIEAPKFHVSSNSHRRVVLLRNCSALLSGSTSPHRIFHSSIYKEMSLRKCNFGFPLIALPRPDRSHPVSIKSHIWTAFRNHRTTISVPVYELFLRKQRMYH